MAKKKKKKKKKKNGSDFCNFYGKLHFWKKIIFFIDFRFLMFHNNIVNVLNFRNFEQEELLVNQPQVSPPYQFLHILQPVLLWGKMNVYD